MTADAPPRALGLHTDLYELRMVEAYLALGMTGEATFSLFCRPRRQRPWLLASGLDRVLELLDGYRFDGAQLDYLRGQGIGAAALEWLRGFEVQGEIVAVPDGTIVLGDEPLLEVTAPLPVAQLLETALINVVHLDTLIATKAARCVLAAAGRPVVDFGFRRAHGLEAGIRAARAAYLAGCTATSNVEAGHRYGLPITGTMAHAFVQAHDDERVAFRHFARTHPDAVTLLVDTYDVADGIANAIAVADELADEGVVVEAVRIDSEPLAELATSARAALDDAGHPDIRVIATGGLDEESIAALVAAEAPIDGFGVGTAMVVSRDRPALDAVYKLVSFDGRPRAKYSTNKRVLPGAKQVFRAETLTDDVLEVRGAEGPGEPLLVPVWRDGARLVEPDLDEARVRARAGLELVPAAWRDPDGVEPPPVPTVGPVLTRLAAEVEARERG